MLQFGIFRRVCLGFLNRARFLYLVLFALVSTIILGWVGWELRQNNNISIGISACLKVGVFRTETFLETVVTLIKSILISARVFKIRRHLELYLFVDESMRAVLSKRIMALREDVGNEINFSVKFRSIADMPKVARRDGRVLYEHFEFPCTYVRLLFPVMSLMLKLEFYLLYQNMFVNRSCR